MKLIDRLLLKNFFKGVDVTVAFYEKGFHGVLTFIDSIFSYSIAYKMLDDLTGYIESNI